MGRMKSDFHFVIDCMLGTIYVYYLLILIKILHKVNLQHLLYKSCAYSSSSPGVSLLHTLHRTRSELEKSKIDKTYKISENDNKIVLPWLELSSLPGRKVQSAGNPRFVIFTVRGSSETIRRLSSFSKKSSEEKNVKFNS